MINMDKRYSNIISVNYYENIVRHAWYLSLIVGHEY